MSKCEFFRVLKRPCPLLKAGSSLCSPCFLRGMRGGVVGSLLTVSFMVLALPSLREGFLGVSPLRGDAFEVVTVDSRALQKRFAKRLAAQNLSSSQEEQQIHLFWSILQEKIHTFHPYKTTVVLAREGVLNRDLQDITEDLWKGVEDSFKHQKPSVQGKGRVS